MTFLLSKIEAAKNTLLNAKGSLLLFAVIKRSDLEYKWDLLISAEWVEDNNKSADIEFLIKLLRNEFGEEFDFISRVLILKSSEKIIKDILNSAANFGLANGYKGELKIDDNFVINEIQLVHVSLPSENDNTEQEVKFIQKTTKKSDFE